MNYKSDGFTDTSIITHFLANKKTTSEEVVFSGGDGEDRTLDLLNAIQALSRYTQKRTPYGVLKAVKNYCYQAMIFDTISILSTEKIFFLAYKLHTTLYS